MSKIIELLTSFLQNLGVLRPNEAVEETLSQVESHTEPHVGQIDHEPLFAIEGDKLVMAVDHYFANMPNWVEWDSERKVVTITQMNGDLDEAPANLKKEYEDRLKKSQRLILVSNQNANDDNNERITHTVPFLSR